MRASDKTPLTQPQPPLYAPPHETPDRRSTSHCVVQQPGDSAACRNRGIAEEAPDEREGNFEKFANITKRIVSAAGLPRICGLIELFPETIPRPDTHLSIVSNCFRNKRPTISYRQCLNSRFSPPSGRLATTMASWGIRQDCFRRTFANTALSLASESTIPGHSLIKCTRILQKSRLAVTFGFLPARGSFSIQLCLRCRYKTWPA